MRTGIELQANQSSSGGGELLVSAQAARRPETEDQQLRTGANRIGEESVEECAAYSEPRGTQQRGE